MSIFNRMMVVLLALAMLVGAMLVLMSPNTLVIAGNAIAGAGRDALSNLQMPYGGPVTYAALAVVALAAVLLALELWPRPGPHFESGVEGAVVDYSPATIRNMVRQELEQTEGVLRAHPDVRRRGKGIDLHVHVETEPGQDSKELAARASARVRERLERGLGLRVERVRLTVRPGRAHRELFGRRV